MSEKISLLIVDDQQLLLEGIRLLLEMEEDLTVVGEANNGQEAIDLYVNLRPDVVLMDVRMPEMNGVEATRRICTHDPQGKVIILTTFDNDEYIFEGVRAGALGYMLKGTSGSQLAEAVRLVYQGDAWMEASVVRSIIGEFTRLPIPADNEAPAELFTALNGREKEILSLLVEGHNNREIATRLFLAEGTVKNYVSAVIRKLNVKDRVQAAVRAKEWNLV